MRFKKDFENFLKYRLESIIEDHFEVWKDRYYRMSARDVFYDLQINYDFSADLEYVSEELGRELSLDEQSYFIDKFEKTAYKIFYK